MGEAAVVLKDLSVEYEGTTGRIPAIHDFTLSIEDGEFVTIVGPSGSGKSTLLKVVAGFVQPTSGTILVDGESGEPPRGFCGYVAQDYVLFPWLTLEQNISFGSRSQEMSPAARRQACQDALEWVELEGKGGLFPHELSGGMKQRAALARALLNEPRILLLDEPFGALDEPLRRQMQSLILSLWQKRHTTVLFATHDVEEALLLGDRSLVISRGPGRLMKDVRIKFPRPRTLDIIYGQEFVALRKEIASDLLGDRN